MKAGQVIGWRASRRGAWTPRSIALFWVFVVVDVALITAIAIERGGCR